MTDIDAPNGYTLQFDGQGGAAGFARGEARVTLAARTSSTRRSRTSRKAQIGGKLAQIGSRLVDGAAAKLTDDFFARFVTRLAPAPPACRRHGDERRAIAVDDAIRPAARPPRWRRRAVRRGSAMRRSSRSSSSLIVLYARGYR